MKYWFIYDGRRIVGKYYETEAAVSVLIVQYPLCTYKEVSEGVYMYMSVGEAW